MASTLSDASNPAAPIILELLFFLCTACGLLSSPASSTSAQGRRFVTKLIHRDSVFSPFYNPNCTIHDRAELARTTSIARFASLTSTARNPSSLESPDYQAEVLPELSTALFMARLSFGEPPARQLVAVDTGSTLLWIQCLPCAKCFPQLEPMFDPGKSATYENIPCQDPECTDLPMHMHGCDARNKCVYSISYMDSTSSHGLLSFEQVTIGTSDDGLATIPKVVVGCANKNDQGERPRGQISGVLGLGPGPKSNAFVHKVGKKFSYCVGNMDDHSYQFSQLAMGEAARLEGDSTPMQLHRNGYLITVEGISVGAKRLNVARGAFQGGAWLRAGVMVDSGTTLTFLATEGYSALRNEVAGLMENGMIEAAVGRYGKEVCYKGVVRRDLKGFPVTTFHLAEGAELVVDIDGVFRQVEEDVFCLAVAETQEGSMIGILAQQYYNVGYDLDEGRIYFQRIDCELLVS
uniref:Peptidase A1 domain-containing protein n=1 Tax=Kalanchoe fedtschenkoi TaxID=63787 RepID=A0A7N0VEZ2_KALFE